jgi:hypothetical protein
MAQWSEFVSVSPHLAAVIHDLLHQYGPGLGYLATVRADGGPRVHPVSPVVCEGRLFCFIIASPKRDDLSRDGRYALHTFPSDRSEDDAYLAGRATRVTDPGLVARLGAEMRASSMVDWWLFELTVEVAVAVHNSGTPTAVREVWRDPGVRSRPRAVDSVQ